jgi:Phycobilisome degradation protein nblA
MSQPIEFSLEQQFQLKTLQDSVKDLSTDELKARLTAVCKHLMLAENVYKEQLKKQWGIEK